MKNTTENTVFNCQMSDAGYFRDALAEIANKKNLSTGQLVQSIFEDYIKRVGDADHVLDQLESQDFCDAIDYYEKNGSSSEQALAKLFFVIDVRAALVRAFPKRFERMLKMYQLKINRADS